MNRLHLIRALMVCSFLGAAATFAAGTASADASSITVSYRDLNLSHPRDVQVLYQRLRHAAATVCVEVPSYDLARYPAYLRCFRSTLNRAVNSVHAPALSAIHRAAETRPEEIAAANG